MSYFLKTLKMIGNFYELCGQPSIAVKFYRQLFIGSLSLKNHSYVCHALTGLASCCDAENLYQEGVQILKKALEYAWMSRRKEL